MSHMIRARKIEEISKKRTEKQQNRKEGVRKAAGSQRRGPQSSKFAKKEFAEQKVWEPLGYCNTPRLLNIVANTKKQTSNKNVILRLYFC